MPLYMRVPAPGGTRDIKTGQFYDNEADLKHSGDYPPEYFEVWTEKGKLFVQIKTKRTNPQRWLKTPNKECFY